ncbi:hypothetical protein [Cyanobium sp. ATX-6F1]|uniref:hypothetical protein n=1 Tax=Cyanobium sp. ATX-6F1 TaxID=3137388 RepID=UPI0039BDE0AF
MTDPSASAGFSGRRGRTFARVTAYTLLALFLVSAVPAALPFALAQPERLFGSLREILERSTLPVVALVVLYAGLSGEAAPSLWEARLAIWLRPLLRLVALLYLLTAVAIVAVAGEVQSQGLAQFKGQLQANLTGLAELRQQFNAAPDATVLRRLLEQQPPSAPFWPIPAPPGQRQCHRRPAAPGGPAAAGSGRGQPPRR